MVGGRTGAADRAAVDRVGPVGSAAPSCRLHGRETGLLERLPHGECLEVHEPLAPDRLFVLPQHEQSPPYETGPREDANGVRRPVTVSQRVRARLARAMFGPESHIPKPSREEYRELTRGDHRR